jgi:hypothetical protein
MKHGTYKIVEGDATLPQHSDNANVILVPHVCNNIGAWGAGFVLAISKRFGYTPMAEYKNGIESKGLVNEVAFDSRESDKELTLGDAQFVLVDENKVNTFPNQTYIVNMIGQEGTSVDLDNLPIRYDALAFAMHLMAVMASDKQFKKEWSKVEIHCPKFGCGLAGGDWVVVEALIKNIWVRRGFDVTVYEYKAE